MADALTARGQRRRAAGLVMAAAAAALLPAVVRSEQRQADSKVSSSDDPWIAAHVGELVALYTHFHTHPELSTQEVETSRRIAEELRKAGADRK